MSCYLRARSNNEIIMIVLFASPLFLFCLVGALDTKLEVAVTNDGPAVIDGWITFHCNLNPSIPQSHLLSYTFSDGIQTSTIEAYNSSTSIRVVFPASQYKSGFYNMSVSVKTAKHSKHEDVVSNYTTFRLTDYLNGEIIIWQEDRYDVYEVAVGESATFFIQLHDPSGYLLNAEIDYKWSIDHERQFYQNNNLSYTYSIARKSHIVAAVVARLNTGNLVYGYFIKSISVEVPVYNVSYLGNPFFHHGDMLHLNISCKGSSPFAYCTKYYEGNETLSNFTCSLPAHTSTCSFQVQLYIHNSGTSHIGIYISNSVSIERKFIELYVYTVSKKPQLSVVIIPIVCSLLTLVIIAGGIAFYVQQRSHLPVEVANFDFQDDSDSYVERTFFEKLLDPLLCRTCDFGNRRNSDCSETFSETVEPLLACDSTKSYS